MYRCGKREGAGVWGGRGQAGGGGRPLSSTQGVSSSRTAGLGVGGVGAGGGEGEGLMQNCPGIPSEWSEGPSHGSGAGEADRRVWQVVAAVWNPME